MTEHHGPVRACVGYAGTGIEIPIPADHPNAATTICWWFITAPGYHPFWSQYVLGVIDLADRPGALPAKLQFPGATHELFVFAANPEIGILTPTNILERAEPGDPSICLTPVNVVHQFTATDEEMRELAYLCCRGVVLGRLNPETGDAPLQIRETWLAACVQTLAHMRGEEHAGHGH